MTRLFRLIVIIVLVNKVSYVSSQSNRVGIIDFYGATSTESELRKCLPFMENDSLTFLTKSAYPIARTKITECLLSQRDIKQTEISFVCCDDNGDWIVFVGVDTRPAKPIKSIKLKDRNLPMEMTATYDSLTQQIMIAAQNGEMSEDDSNGHALTNYLPARRLEEKFITYANQNLNLLREVLRSSSDRKQREVSATIISYYRDKKVIINDLINAVTDPDEGVRNAAVRAIGIIAKFSQQRPELRIKISADPFIDMLNSISWTDRNKSGYVLQSLTQSRDKKVLKQIKRKALPSIVAMANWKSQVHSFPSYIILGRMAGWGEEEIMDGASDNKVESIERMVATIK